MVAKLRWLNPPFSLAKTTLAPKATFGSILVVLWLPFGSLLLPLGSLLAPFGTLFAPFGSFLVHFWLPLFPFWLPFGFFALSFACFWLAFGSRLLSFAIPSSPFCYFRLRAYKFLKKKWFYKASEAAKQPFFSFLLISETSFCRKFAIGTLAARIRRSWEP